MTIEELHDIISCDESYRIERTVSTSNMDKFQEAICAFANDMPGKRQKGYLLIGVYDDGRISGLKVDDALMKKNQWHTFGWQHIATAGDEHRKGGDTGWRCLGGRSNTIV